MMRRILPILLSLFATLPAVGAKVYYWDLQVDVRPLADALISRGYISAFDGGGATIGEAMADIHHTIVGTDAQYSVRMTAPYSKMIQSSHPGYAGFCYTGRLSVYPEDGSSHLAASEQLCFYGPPPPPPPDVDDPGGCGFCDSPIIIALDDVYRLTSFEEGVQFDLRNEGRAGQIAWTAADSDNAFLVLDRNANGRVDHGGELFGNFTLLRSGARARNGFEALAELDEDGNGVVDAGDASWPALQLWLDRDHDGVCDPGEMQQLDGTAITGLETGYRVAGRRDQWGNRFRYQSQIRLGSQRRTYYDVFLVTTR